MPKQTLFLTSPAEVCIKNSLLQISVQGLEGTPFLRTIEDIHTIIVDNHSVHITTPALNQLSKHSVSVVFCDERHMPISMLQTLDSSSIQGKLFRSQIEAGSILKKQLWEQIIERKIRNQSLLLQKLGLGNDPLQHYYSKVLSGDASNREGQAAKQYWKILLGKSFIRDRLGNPPNNLLNYGYSILRAYTTRALLGSGLLPSLGIFHRNYFNSFPLADDTMEPYRPFIDEIVWKLYQRGEETINKKVKKEIVSLFYENISLDDLSMTSHSLATYLTKEGKIIYYPKLQ